MAEAILTLSRALDRATSGQVIAPDSKRQAQVRASMGMAVNVLARQAASRRRSTSLAPEASAQRSSHIATSSSELKPILPNIERIWSPKRGRLLITGKPQACSESEEAFTSRAVHHLGIMISRRRVDRQAKSLCRSQAQNGERYDCRLCSRQYGRTNPRRPTKRAIGCGGGAGVRGEGVGGGD